MASWLLKGLIMDKETRTTLYEVIDVNPKATEEEIRSAYKRRAVQLHPDKVRQRGGGDTATAVAEFQRLKEAYDVLNNKERRKLYDEYGEGGLKLIENPSSIENSYEILFKNFLTMRNRDRMKLCLFIIILMGSLLLAPILYCTQIDGHINASWTALATPVWFYDAVILFFLHLAVLAGKTPEPDPKDDSWTDPSPLKWRVHALLCFYFIVAFELMVTLRLDGFITFLWSYVFFVWYGFEALLWIQLIPRIFQKIPPKPLPNDGDSSPDRNIDDEYLESMAVRLAAQIERGKAIVSSLWSLYRIVQLLMIGLKNDNICDWNWWAIFWPTYACCTLLLLRIMILYKIGMKHLALAKALGQLEGREESNDNEPLKDRVVANMYIDKARSGLFVMVLVLFMALMGIGRIAGAGYSSFFVLLPVFIISGCCMCCSTCAICCFRSDPKDVDSIIGGGGPSVPKENDNDLEQWGNEGPSNKSHVSSYGTYVPPEMPVAETHDNTPPIKLGAVSERHDSADID